MKQHLTAFILSLTVALGLIAVAIFAMAHTGKTKLVNADWSCTQYTRNPSDN